jgi:hypothetical protein
MKSRWLAIAVALTGLSVTSWAQTQNPGSDGDDKDKPKSGDVQNAPAPPPAALPSQDDADIKRR